MHFTGICFLHLYINSIMPVADEFPFLNTPNLKHTITIRDLVGAALIKGHVEWAVLMQNTF